MVHMASGIYLLLLSTIALVIATNISYDGGFNREKCLVRTLDFIGNGTLASDNQVFYRDDTGQPMVHPENLTLTLPGCRKLCGPKQMWYWDIGPRISTWLIPILLLISNVELSPLDKRRFLAIIHLLGDPLDSIWSLIHKIDSWDRCYRLAGQYNGVCERCQRVIATVFAGLEEIEGPRITSQAYFFDFASTYGLTTQFWNWRQMANELADNRTDEFFRTCLAIFLYIYQVIAGFIEEVGGGNTTLPGGRIATGMLISWLVPAVLLSNTIGGFPSRRTAYNILDRFTRRAEKPFHIPPSRSILLPGVSCFARTSSSEFFQSLSWSGAIYTFRPWKTQHVTSERYRLTTALIFFLSVSPICIGMTGGFILLWHTLPKGVNCRHMWLIGIFLTWFMSTFITWLSYSPKFATGKHHWHFILAKDTLIALASFLIIFLSACGLFNSCRCWSGFLYYHGSAHVPLNLDPAIKHNGRTVYPTIVGVCLILQFLVFATIAIIWRRGLKVIRWSDRARREEWEKVMGLNRRTCECSLPLELRP